MAMIAALDNGTFFVAWQAASRTEGSSEQDIQYSVGNLNFAGALQFGEPKRAPVGSGEGAVWGPVLHVDHHNAYLWLFYSESRGSCKGSVMEWAPGGDIMALQMDLMSGAWSKARAIYSLQEDRGIPKVTANQALVLSTGEWILPFWRERALLSFSPACRELDGDTSAGVLISYDEGFTWEAHGEITHPESWLIENAVSEMPNGEVVMVFRTEVGFVYVSRSHDKGRTWVPAVAISQLPNPNSKVDLAWVTSDDRGALAVVFNDHQEARRDLRVALSWDAGRTWTRVATIEAGEEGVHLHYPTMVQYGCYLVVVYSRFYARTRHWAREHSKEQGIRIAAIDLRHLSPQPSYFDHSALQDPEQQEELQQIRNQADAFLQLGAALPRPLVV
ncbi:hypothetical protein CYMTET_37090 [Cymbomonas tetramitiformis]|uniref:Sialidase domain-containing protein n=1 Tax=Cymbomonas tetramitiformis TaxID=36881 RepID=A0AAE0CG31_9CHLO|nr:hypothetical protein CYMTET_37090 [Cymbomonas tetramitiformis]